MGIVRNDELKNLDTNTPVRFANHRLTRAQVHRILKKQGIQHNHAGTLNYMLDLCEQNNVPLVPAEPGELKVEPRVVKQEEKREEAPPKEVQMAADGFPKLVPVLKSWCKERGIPVRTTDKRKDLIERLKEYQKNPHGYTT